MLPEPLLIGHVLAAPLSNLQMEEGHSRKGASCLLKILLMESAYLIWKLRCEQLLDHPDRDLGPEITKPEAETGSQQL